MKKKTSNHKATTERDVVVHGPTLFMREKESRNSFLRREFLTLPGSIETSYVLAVVANSGNGRSVGGWNGVVIGDSMRIICLEFSLRTPEARKVALYKIKTLLQTLARFRDALVLEATEIENAVEEEGQ